MIQIPPTSQNSFQPRWELPPSWLRFTVIILLGMGLFFRFANLDRKIYWGDEAFTSLRIAGYTEAELVQQVFTGREIGIEDLHKYLHPHPERGLFYTVKALAKEDPQHPPLYYIMVRLWVQFFGDSVAITRSLSALISLLVFPCVYWLCLELFELSLTGWFAISLIAVSPFHMLLAQEAREYSLWTVTILLSSMLLLRAMRLNTKLSWATHTVALAIGLYTFTFSVLIAIGHGIYVLAIEKFRLTNKVINYLVSSLVGFLAFLPWLSVIIINMSEIQRTTAWANDKISLGSLSKAWTLNLSRLFFDFNHSFQKENLLLYAGSIIVGYALYFLARKSSNKARYFTLTLIAPAALFLALPDLISGGVRSTTPRYLIPCYLGIQIAIAYLLTAQVISPPAGKSWGQKLWQIVAVTLLSLGVLSCAFISDKEVSWNKFEHDHHTPEMARIINQSPHPLLLSDTWVGRVMPFSYLLNSKTRLILLEKNRAKLQLMNDPLIPQIREGFSDIFLFSVYQPSELLKYRLEKERHYKLEPAYNHPIYKEPWLWRLTK